MSLLLDALRKADRQRRDRPDSPPLRDEPPPPARRPAASPALLAGLLLLANALAVTGFVYWYEPAPAQHPATPPAATPVPERSAARGPVRPLQAEAAPARAPARDVPAADAATGAAATPPATAPVTPPVTRAPAAGTPPADSSLARLHVDMHVWSEDPARRFVLINMRRYREGSRLPGGARIVEIRPEGVLVEQAGERYLLPRR